MHPTVRCKFVCETTTTEGAGADRRYHAKFRPVHGGSPENESFWRWTPAGAFEVWSLRDQSFEPGKEYYLDITPAN